MYAGAAVEVIDVVVAVATASSLKSPILTRHPGHAVAPLHTGEVSRAVPLVVGGAIAIGLWLWMAWANGRGRNWARAVSAVLFGINTLDLLGSIYLVRAPVATLIVGALLWLVGLGAIVFIFRKESAPFYRQQPGL
jgi:hypothetical protein